MKFDVYDVGHLLGIKLPIVGKYGLCPLRKHARGKGTFRIFKSKDGDLLWKCWSCDAPNNVGDAVKLYAVKSGIDRKEALQELKERGYSTSGRSRWSKDDIETPRLVDVTPPEGEQPKSIATLSLKRWREWKASTNGLVTRFAESRGIRPETMMANDVVEVGSGAVGFSYRDVEFSVPCRVKCRPVDEKKYWIEPKGADGSRALSPLYLAHELKVEFGQVSAVVVTEGEVDALTLKDIGWRNVVSLPDGSESADKVDLRPLLPFKVWFIATDDDEPGAKASRTLVRRAHSTGNVPIRLTFVRFVGDELVRHKDANEALLAGFTRQDFEHCCYAVQDEWGTRFLP